MSAGVDTLFRLDGTTLLAAVAANEVSVEDVARACLDRVAAREPEVRAWAWIDREAVLQQARAMDGRGKGQGRHLPLHGLPIAVKDVIDTQDMPTQHNSPLYEGHRPALDAACVAVLRAAGALIMGKTETVEFAAGGRLPPTRNPFDLARTPGGTSSGSAAAVADGHVPVALATQTSGSTIRPASFCGVHAFKPSWGLVSREGVKMFANSLDTVTWMARSVRDLDLIAAVFDLPGDPVPTQGPAGLRIGICRGSDWSQAEEPTRTAMQAAIGALRAAGATLMDVELPQAFAPLVRHHGVLMDDEARRAFLNEHRRHGDRLHPNLRRRVENAGNLTSADLREAHDTAAACRRMFDDLAGEFDAILAPSSPGVAPSGFTTTGNSVFNRVWTLLHVPCVNVPLWSSAAGLPVGLTLTAPRFSDRRLLDAARTVAASIGALDGVMSGAMGTGT